MCIVYEIRNTATGDTYIGSATNGDKRWSEHRAHLRKGVHHCKPLVRDWNRYGEDAFAFTVIHTVCGPYAVEMMRLLEIAYIRNLQPTYNGKYPPCYSLAASPTGYRREMSGQISMCPIQPRRDESAG